MLRELILLSWILRTDPPTCATNAEGIDPKEPNAEAIDPSEPKCLRY
jgi:hypothetical protein